MFVYWDFVLKIFIWMEFVCNEKVYLFDIVDGKDKDIEGWIVI